LPLYKERSTACHRPGWRGVERTYVDGVVVRWIERPKPGKPGVLQRYYTVPEDRFSGAIGTAHLAGGTMAFQSRPSRLRAKAKPAARTAPKPVERETPELRADAKPQLTIRLGSFALGAIVKEISLHRDAIERDEWESGGWLFGEWSGGAWHAFATGLGSGKTMRHKVVLDFAEAARKAASLDAIGARKFLGSWHVHPTGTREPSSVDRRAALATFEAESMKEFRPGRYGVDVIVTPHPTRGYRAPVYSGWHTYRTPAGTAVTIPATVETATSPANL